ncbi:MAG: ABC transporter substrate-binding protein, partial [Olsenella sp.]
MLTRRQAIKAFAAIAAMAPALAGCSSGDSGTTSDGVTNIEIVSYKQEATKVFAQIQDGFNATHDNIHLTISSPKEAMTVLKTRFVREDYPDIIGFGGDVNYSDFVEAGILADLSSFQGLSQVKQSYLDILDTLEYIPTDGTFGLPWMANAAGVL